MLQKVQGAAPFQVLTNAFSISPSNEGYDLQISSDGFNYSTLFSVGAGVTRMVTGVANGSYYRLLGNESEVIVNWNRSCGGGGSEGSGGTPYILPIASASELGGIKVGDGLAIDPSTGVLSVSGGSHGGDSQVLLPSSALPQDWVSYDDNQFNYVREDIVNDGVYLMHWDDNNLYCGVDVAGGVITGGSYYMTEGQDGVWHSDREGYENITAWVAGGKLYWRNPYDNVSMLDAYENGANRQGCSVEVEVENGIVRATTDGLFQYDGIEWKQIDNSLLSPVSELPSSSVDGGVYAKADYGIVQAQGTKTGDEWTTLEDWTSTPFSQVRLPYVQSAGFAIRYSYEGGPHQDVGFEWNGSTWDTGFNTGTITDGEWSGSENGMTGTCVHSGDYLVLSFTGQPIILSWNWNNAEAKVPTEVTNYVNAVMSDAVVKIWRGTAAEYADLPSTDADTLYIIL